jgi:hypothetical protein
MGSRWNNTTGTRGLAGKESYARTQGLDARRNKTILILREPWSDRKKNKTADTRDWLQIGIQL